MHLDLMSELASLLYVAGVVDGRGAPVVSTRELTRVARSVTLDKPRSVSGLIRFDLTERADGCEVRSNAPNSFDQLELFSRGEVG